MHRTPWLVALDVALVAAVVLGVTGFARSDKDVALSVDGQSRAVHTYADTVSDLLGEEGIVVTDRDVVTPDTQAPLSDGDDVSVLFARQLSVTVDGEPIQIWTTALTVEGALEQLGVRSESAVVSASRSERLPLTGFKMGVQLPDRVTILADGRRTTMVTAAATVGAALREAGVQLTGRDRVDISPRARVSDGMTVTVLRVAVADSRRGFSIAGRTIRRADDSRYEGSTRVIRPGRDGRGVAIYRMIRHDGIIVRQELVDRKVLRPPVTRVVRYGTKPRPFVPLATGASGLNWSALAQCESGGNPSSVNAAGYYGLYQFAIGTWYSVGGTGNPIEASSTEQTYRAQLLYERSGASPWPVCGSLLFY